MNQKHPKWARTKTSPNLPGTPMNKCQETQGREQGLVFSNKETRTLDRI